MDARVFIDLDALSRGALEELRRVMREAMQARGRFAAALAGGGFTAFETGRGGPRCVAVSRFSGLSQKRSGVMAVGAPAKPLQRLTLTPVFVNRGDTDFSGWPEETSARSWTRCAPSRPGNRASIRLVQYSLRDTRCRSSIRLPKLEMSGLARNFMRGRRV